MISPLCGLLYIAQQHPLDSGEENRFGKRKTTRYRSSVRTPWLLILINVHKIDVVIKQMVNSKCVISLLLAGSKMLKHSGIIKSLYFQPAAVIKRVSFRLARIMHGDDTYTQIQPTA